MTAHSKISGLISCFARSFLVRKPNFISIVFLFLGYWSVETAVMAYSVTDRAKCAAWFEWTKSVVIVQRKTTNQTTDFTMCSQSFITIDLVGIM